MTDKTDSMFVVIDPSEGQTFGNFVHYDEALVWATDNLGPRMHLPHGRRWYVNEVEQVQSDCARKLQ